MMTEENMWVLLDGWLDGAVRSYAYIMGSEGIKNFLKSAAEVAYTHLHDAATNEGLPPVRGATPEEVMRNVSKMEAAMGVMQENNLEVTTTPDGLTLTHLGCPYASVCSDILSDLVDSAKSQTVYPCFRTETYMAAAAMETGCKGKYLLKQYAPGERCIAQVEFI
jgi:hypothetical protein